MQTLTAAYAHMKYDLFMRAAPEPKQKASFIQSYPQKEAKLIIKSVPEGNIAFVLFPEKNTNKTDEDRLVRLAKELRQTKRYNLIVGVSSWGADREQDFLERHGEAFDILLGSGPGAGYSGQYLRDNRVVWVRPFTMGKSALSVTIPNLPKPGEKTAWVPDKSIMVASHPLSNSYAPDPEVEKLFTP